MTDVTETVSKDLVKVLLALQRLYVDQTPTPDWTVLESFTHLIAFAEGIGDEAPQESRGER